MEQRELPTEEKQDKGFTLIELLIVIVILGILATVTVIAVNGITDSAEKNSCQTDLATITTAYEAVKVQGISTEVDANGIPTLTGLRKQLGTQTANSVDTTSSATTVKFTYVVNTAAPWGATITGVNSCSLTPTLSANV